MATTAPPATCETHPRRPRVATCVTCGRSLCDRCMVKSRVGMKCASCAGVALPTPSKARWAVPLVVLAVVAAGLGIVLATRGGGGGGGTTAATDPVDAPAAAGSAAAERTLVFPGAGGVSVGATLTVPARRGEAAVPVVLIVPDVGPTTRDGLVPATAAPDPLYRDLAQSLADAGLASLRYDRRGTGTSKLKPGQAVGLDDLVADARQAVSLLAQRAETAGAPMAVLGHGVGGAVALREAASDPRVSSVVLVSTAGRPEVDALADGFAATNGQASADAFRAVAAQMVASGAVPPLDSLRTEHRDLFLSGDAAWLRSLFELDPAADAARVSQPVLVVRGSRSTSDTPVDADRLAAALGTKGEQAVGPDDGATLMVVPPGVPDPLHPGGPAAVSDHENGMGGSQSVPAGTRDARLVASVVIWLRAHLGPR